jgi:hypothetical protein
VTIIDGQNGESETNQDRGQQGGIGTLLGPWKPGHYRGHIYVFCWGSVMLHPLSDRVHQQGLCEKKWFQVFLLEHEDFGKVTWCITCGPLRILEAFVRNRTADFQCRSLANCFVQENPARVGLLLSLWRLIFCQPPSLLLSVFVRQRTQLRLPQRRMQGKGREYLEQE